MTTCPVCETENETTVAQCTRCNWQLVPARKKLFLVPSQTALNQFNEQLRSARQRYEKSQEVSQFKTALSALEQTVAQLQQNYEQLQAQSNRQAQEITQLKTQIRQWAEDGEIPFDEVDDWNDLSEHEDDATPEQNPDDTVAEPTPTETASPIEADVWVATNGSGDYTSIQEAINAATNETKIGIRAGDYYSATPGQPCVILNKPVFLIGESNDMSQVRLHGQIKVDTTEGGLKNLSISGECAYAVTIEQGNIAFENTNVLMGINARGNASVILAGSKVHGSPANGIRIEAGMLLMENTEVSENAYDGIFISPEGSYTLKSSHVHDNLRYGINSRTMMGRGIIEETRFNTNQYGGVLVLNGQYITIKDCPINFNAGPGVYINESKVTITGCDLASNQGKSIEEHGNSTVNAVNNRG